MENEKQQASTNNAWIIERRFLHRMQKGSMSTKKNHIL